MAQSTLKREAETILKDLDLLKLLCTYGTPRVVGSVALDLMVRSDIDVHVVTDCPDLLRVAVDICHVLLKKKDVSVVRISDFQLEEGIAVAIEHYPRTSGTWSIDIWITNNPETTGFNLVDTLEKTITSEQRDSILRIKEYYFRQGLLRNGLSRLIYEAVCEKGVKSIAQFEEFLSKN